MKPQRIITVAALSFFVAAFTFHAPAVRAADYVFAPGELPLNPADWRNMAEDPDWSIKPPFIIHRHGQRLAKLSFNRPIPNYFEIAFELIADTLAKNDGKGISICCSTTRRSVCIDDVFPFQIFDVPSQKVVASKSTFFKLRTGHPCQFIVRVESAAITATVDGKTISAPWTAGLPFTIAFMADRAGMRVKAIKITEIKK